MRIILFLFLTVTLIGCKPYMRYRTDAEITPRDRGPSTQHLTTGEYLRLGSILQTYLGKPYSGRSRWDPGLDCSKFVYEVFKAYDKTELPRQAADQYERGDEVVRNRLKFGDLVFFRTDRSRISHVGIYVGFSEFIHASTSQGVIISNLGEEYWAKRYVGAKRILKTGE